MIAERGLEDRRPLEPREEGRDLGLDRVGERGVGRDEQGRGVRAVLGLGDEIGGDERRVGGGVGEDHPLRRAGGQVDADERADLDLGGGDPRVARTDDPVDRLQARVGQAERERADRLGAARDEQRVDAEQPGGAGDDRVDPAVRTRRATRRRSRRRRRRAPGRPS